MITFVVKVLFNDMVHSMVKLDSGTLGGFVVEGHSSIGLVTFVVKVLFIDKVHSMINFDRRIKQLRGICC